MIYGRKAGNEIMGEPVETSGSRKEILSVRKGGCNIGRKRERGE
jgi:hypothetical protein